MRAEPVKLTPLTQEERQFAEENYQTVQWVISNHRLDEDLHDIAYMGYLHAVKKWFARPDLKKWAFRTIANQTIRSHISAEKRKQEKRIATVSLEAEVPGTEGLSYMSTITYENISYLSGKEGESMALKINYDVAIPEAAKLGRTPSVEIEMLAGFLDSSHKTMSLEYAEPKEAASKCGTLRNWRKKNHRTDFEIYRMAGTIYIEKNKTKAGRKQV